MNEWAMLKDGQIVNVITTVDSRSEVQRRYPDHEIADVYSLPPLVQKRYQHWFERP